MGNPRTAAVMDSQNALFVRREGELRKDLERVDRQLVARKKVAKEDAKEHREAIQELEEERDAILKKLESGQLELGDEPSAEGEGNDGSGYVENVVEDDEAEEGGDFLGDEMFEEEEGGDGDDA